EGIDQEKRQNIAQLGSACLSPGRFLAVPCPTSRLHPHRHPPPRSHSPRNKTSPPFAHQKNTSPPTPPLPNHAKSSYFNIPASPTHTFPITIPIPSSLSVQPLCPSVPSVVNLEPCRFLQSSSARELKVIQVISRFPHPRLCPHTSS